MRRGQPRTGVTPGTMGIQEKQVSACPQTQNLVFLQFEEQKMSCLVGELSKVLCRAEITEA